MSSDAPTWRDRLPDEVTCIRCLEVRSTEELDRLLWCEECLERGRRRAVRIGWMGGGVIGLLVAAYIWFGIQPDLSLIPALWGATVGVAFYLGGRVTREITFGVMRLRNQRAVEARPPEDPVESDRPPDPDTR